jgi:RNA polymerase sigma-B factor
MTSPATAARSTIRQARTQQTKELFDRAHAARGSEERRLLLDEIIVLNMTMADAVVSRYAGRGVASEDLRQVAYAALTRAAHRFDPTQGTEFVAFAVPTMRGEVRKHFRDHAWMVRPTRRIQELQPQINRAEDELWRELGRSPRPSEIADRVGASLESVVEALSTDGCFVPSSLDKPAQSDGSGPPLGELLGAADTAQELAETRVVLQPLIRRLSERDRRILEMRFLRDLTQREIAEDIGVTQMQVSRLLSRIYRDLRDGIGRLDDGAVTQHEGAAD